jgi:ribosome biogenesis GTPase / thiamine phosphate phosphatase
MIDIDFQALRLIGLNHAISSQLHVLDNPAPGTRLMRVTEVHRDAVVLHDGQAQHRARLLARLLHALDTEDTTLATGDWVLAHADEHGELWIGHRLAPVTEIARRANDGRRQALASNVDTALLVMGLDLDFNLRRMERYIALVQAAGVAAVAVLTKHDIGDDVEERMAQLRKRLPASVPALAVNALDPQAAVELAPWLTAGQTLILLGSSGAGKSDPDQYAGREQPGNRWRACWRWARQAHDHGALAAPVCRRRLHHRHAGLAHLARGC